ncbi:hypothetical protein IFM89_034480 [Coptis chinensis]|uniref:Uncharacterized protein n=1 Tax=Coptis chinensis TaxID=261450 RepID=A0A835H6W8_9MAGN|nr:hypothetical protein IFM89_034480 [Coptis chinensis]
MPSMGDLSGGDGSQAKDVEPPIVLEPDLGKSLRYLNVFRRRWDGLKPIQVAAQRSNRSAVEVLLQVTSPVQVISNWSMDGIIEHMQSDCHKDQTKCERSRCARDCRELKKARTFFFYFRRRYKEKKEEVEPEVDPNEIKGLYLRIRQMKKTCFNSFQGLARDLSNNKISGSIPSSVGDLEHLLKLILSKNRLTVLIAEFGNLRSVMEINVSYNNLAGDIPLGKKFSMFPPSRFRWTVFSQSFVGNPGLWVLGLILLATILTLTSEFLVISLFSSNVVFAASISKAAILGIALGVLVILLMILVAACRPHNPPPFSEGALDKPGPAWY